MTHYYQPSAESLFSVSYPFEEVMWILYAVLRQGAINLFILCLRAQKEMRDMSTCAHMCAFVLFAFLDRFSSLFDVTHPLQLATSASFSYCSEQHGCPARPVNIRTPSHTAETMIIDSVETVSF